MLRPSYSDLMNVMIEQGNIDKNVASRYTIVIAAAKRARELIDDENVFEEVDKDKAVSAAVREMYTGHISVIEGEHDPVQVENTGEVSSIEWVPDGDYNH